jgi:hypothetical protein
VIPVRHHFDKRASSLCPVGEGQRKWTRSKPRHYFCKSPLVISPASFAGRRVSRGPSKQGRRYGVSAIFVVQRLQWLAQARPPPIGVRAMRKKSGLCSYNVLCGIHDASKIHGLQQGNKIACPNHGHVLLCALSRSACTQRQHCTVLYIGYRISSHLCQCDNGKIRDEMDEQARSRQRIS